MTAQEFLKQNYGSYIEFKGRWLGWIMDERWEVKEWYTDLDGTRRIKVLVRTFDEVVALHVLEHGKVEDLSN